MKIRDIVEMRGEITEVSVAPIEMGDAFLRQSADGIWQDVSRGGGKNKDFGGGFQLVSKKTEDNGMLFVIVKDGQPACCGAFFKKKGYWQNSMNYTWPEFRRQGLILRMFCFALMRFKSIRGGNMPTVGTYRMYGKLSEMGHTVYLTQASGGREELEWDGSNFIVTSSGETVEAFSKLAGNEFNLDHSWNLQIDAR